MIVVIPAYNEARIIVEVIRGLKQCGFTRLIVVDDGSHGGTGEGIFLVTAGTVCYGSLTRQTLSTEV